MVELVPGPGTAVLDLGNEVVAHRLAVVKKRTVTFLNNIFNQIFLISYATHGTNASPLPPPRDLIKKVK
ncbi:MAG: hypothetical protein PHC35_04710 [Deltaproteobacteria bacterium]|nr:hypothetical protein [Deltaproteobacteria bacterium]